MYICESRVSWQAENGTGFSLEYPHIQLHAVTRDLALTSVPCLYIVVEGDLLEGQRESRNGNGEFGHSLINAHCSKSSGERGPSFMGNPQSKQFEDPEKQLEGQDYAQITVNWLTESHSR